MSNNDVCSTRKQVEELATHWDKFKTYLHAPVVKYDWILSCVDNLLGSSSIYFPTASDGSTPVAVAPLVKPRGFFRAVEQIGVGRHGEPNDFLYKDEESLKCLINGLAREKVPLNLIRVPEESPIISEIIHAYRKKAYVVLRPQVSCPFIPISGNEKHTLDSLPSRLRSDLRRAQRKAEALGEVAFEIYSPHSREELIPLWNESLKVEASGWKGRKQTALAKDKKMSDFFLSYATRACESGILRICHMRINGITVAMQIAIEASNRLWLLKIGYDEEYAKCSPGMLLMLETLQYAAGEGLSSYEFLGIAKEWTRRWTKEERNTVTVRVYPYTLKGIGILGKDAAIYFWRKMGKLFWERK